MNRFKGLDLVDRLPKELWMEVLNVVPEPVTKTIHKKKKCKSLHIAEKRKKQNARGKGKDIPTWMQGYREEEEEKRKSS